MNIELIMEEYSSNEMKKLKKICFPILKKFGGLHESDYDDFYSIANYTLWTAAKAFNEKQNDSFDGFLRDCIDRKFKTEMTKRNRIKRNCDKLSVSLDAPVNSDEDIKLYDTIADTRTVENTVFTEDETMSEEMTAYLDSLSPLQKKIASCISKGDTDEEICEELKITMAHLSNSKKRMFSNEKTMILNKKN